MESLSSNFTSNFYESNRTLEGDDFMVMMGVPLPPNSNNVERPQVAVQQDPMQRMATAFEAKYLGEIPATALGGQGGAALEAVEVRGEPLTDEIAHPPKNKQPASFATQGKEDSDTLHKMNGEPFLTWKIDLGRLICAGNLTITANGRPCPSGDSHGERMKNTLETLARLVKAENVTQGLFEGISLMKEEDINPTKIETYLKENQGALAHFTNNGCALLNAVAQPAMVDLVTNAKSAATPEEGTKGVKKEVGMIEGGWQVKVRVKDEHIMIQHEVGIGEKVFRDGKHTPDANTPTQMVGRYNIVGTIGDDGKVTFTTVKKSVHVLPNENLPRKDYIAIQEKLKNEGLLTENQQQLLAKVTDKKTGAAEYEYHSHATVNPLYKGK